MVFVANLLVPVSVDNSRNISFNQSPTPTQFLPWQIETTNRGSIRVFGLTLNQSTLKDAENLFHGGVEVSLFASPEGTYKVEAYFDKVLLGGFSAKFVMVMGLTQEQQSMMFRRGSRITSLGNGRKRVSLAPEDMQTVYDTPISSLAYITRIRIDEELLHRRFGEADQRIREHDVNTTHWLYPKLGLDVALNDEGDAVLQYVPPVEFSRLSDPLLSNNVLSTKALTNKTTR